ncbi:MAG: alpha/beta hydrolase [Rhizobacter sp.]|nr:alpha/beta hydrolase [Rhizobacter sp.]
MRLLTLPGWQNSGPSHWQTRWEALLGAQRVEQADWLWPRRGDWMARLDEVLLQSGEPAVLIAHSLGCQLVAAWAAHSGHTERVHGALLVAPPDVERDDMPPNLFNWRPMVRARLPFPSIAVISGNDPYGASERMQPVAQGWGSQVVEIGPYGHINGDSGLRDWPDGQALLHSLLEPPRAATQREHD